MGWLIGIYHIKRGAAIYLIRLTLGGQFDVSPLLQFQRMMKSVKHACCFLDDMDRTQEDAEETLTSEAGAVIHVRWDFHKGGY